MKKNIDVLSLALILSVAFMAKSEEKITKHRNQEQKFEAHIIASADTSGTHQVKPIY